MPGKYKRSLVRHLLIAVMCSSDIAVVQNVFNQQLLENIDWSAEKFEMQVASTFKLNQ